MKSLKTLLIVACLAFFSVNISAQSQSLDQSHDQPPTRSERLQIAQNEADHIKQIVTGLTPDQENKIVQIQQDFMEDEQDVRSNSNTSADDIRSKVQSIRQNKEAKIKSILTDEQLAQYEKATTSQNKMSAPQKGK